MTEGPITITLCEEKALIELIGSLYEAAACPERWKDFLLLAARHLNCSFAGITVHDLQNRNRLIGFNAGMPPEAVREYESYYGGLIPFWEPFLAKTLEKGSWHSLAVPTVGERKYLSSEYFNDFGRKYGVCWSVIGATLNGEPGQPACAGSTITALSVSRSYECGELGQDALKLMGQLLPHLKRVTRIHDAMESLRSKTAAAVSALDAAEAALVAVDSQGVIVLTSRKAEEILRERDGLTLRQKRLSVSSSEAASKLESLVLSAAAAGAGRSMHSGGSMLIHRRMRQPLRICVTPFHSSHMFTEACPCALVFISDPDALPAPRATILSSLYQLTPSECRLADLFMQGFDVANAAECLRVTKNTARFMLKSIFSKTGTHRQAELMRFLLVLPALASG